MITNITVLCLFFILRGVDYANWKSDHENQINNRLFRKLGVRYKQNRTHDLCDAGAVLYQLSNKEQTGN